MKATAFVCICQEKDSGHHCDSGGLLTADTRQLGVPRHRPAVSPAVSGSAERFDVAQTSAELSRMPRPERVEGLTVEALSNGCRTVLGPRSSEASDLDRLADDA